MSKRILFVEDEPGLVMTLTDRLRNEGYAVETTYRWRKWAGAGHQRAL